MVRESPPGPPRQTGRSIAGTLAGFAAAAVGFIAARALPPELAIRIIAGGVAGCVVGLIPFFLARKRSEMTLAKIALGVCIVSGLVLGLVLAVPICIVFVIVILTKKPKGEAAEEDKAVPGDLYVRSDDALFDEQNAPPSSGEPGD